MVEHSFLENDIYKDSVKRTLVHCELDERNVGQWDWRVLDEGKRRLERRQDSLVQGLVGHGAHFRFYYICNGNPLKGLEQRSSHILRKHFVDKGLERQ